MTKEIVTILSIALLMPGCFEASGGDKYNPPMGIDEERVFNLYLNDEITTIVVDIDYVEGRAPSELALKGLEENLEIIFSDKNIQFNNPSLIPTDSTSRERQWKTSELREIAKRYAYNSSPNEIVLSIYYLDGTDDVGTAGVFMGFLNAVFIFPDVARSYFARAGDVFVPHPAHDEFDRALLSHEVGHALGLVNNGVPMLTQRLPSSDEDPCQCHSTHQDSPLYYKALDRNWILDKIEEGKHIPYLYNKADLKDISTFIQENS